MMEEIAAAPGQLIELNDGKWRLFEVNGFQRLPLLEAQREGAVLFYRQDFGRIHGLPPGNWITGAQVEQVVVGWAPDQRCWLLGLRLRASAGARWCELVRFPPAPRDSYSTQAQRAARALAEVLGSPLRVIRDPVPASPTTPTPPHADPLAGAPQSALARPATLPPAPSPLQIAYRLPVILGAQVLKEIPAGLRLGYTGRWVLNQVVQIGFSLVLMVVFGFISVRALLTPYAPVHEAWLPFAGLLVMFALAVSAISQAIHLLRAADIVFDRDRGALYYVLTLGRWWRPLRRQARAPMPLRTLKTVVARNLTPNRDRGDWLVFAQTADDAVMLVETSEKHAEDQTARAVQAAAAIASLLNAPMRVMDKS